MFRPSTRAIVNAKCLRRYNKLNYAMIFERGRRRGLCIECISAVRCPYKHIIFNIIGCFVYYL